MRTIAWWAALAVAIVATAVATMALDRVLVDVGSRHIGVDEFEQLLGVMRQSAGASGAIDTLTPTGREKLLNAYVDKTLYATAAHDEGLDARADVRFRIEQAIDEVLAKTFLETRIASVPTSDADLERYYDAHHDQFRTAVRVKASHILLKTDADARAVRARLAGGEPFAQLASALSVDATTRARGGDLGWVTRGTMVKPFEDALFAMKAGETSGVVATSFGYHVIAVDDVQQSTLPPFAAIKNDVQRRVVAARIGALHDELTARYQVHVHADALKAVK